MRLGDGIVLTAFLIFGIFAISEQYNEMAPGDRIPSALIIGMLVALIGASMGYLEAWALLIRPAILSRGSFVSFRLGAFLPFLSPGNYWWVPIVGPFWRLCRAGQPINT